MDIFKDFKLIVQNALKKTYPLIINEIDLESIEVEFPRKKHQGDLTTNVALALSSQLKVSAYDIALQIKSKMFEEGADYIRDIQVIKPGFINIQLSKSYLHKVLDYIVNNLNDFGRQNIGNGASVNIEYVSANPTGPLHIGHGRGAVVGDVLANLYQFMGYKVTKEYYINDSGNQIAVLVNSIFAEYCKLAGNDIPQLDECYKGEYIKDVAQIIFDKDGLKWADKEYSEVYSHLSSFAIDHMMESIKQDLSKLGVKHDVFSSEKAIMTNSNYQKLKNNLQANNLLYMGVLEDPKGVKSNKSPSSEKLPQLIFKTTKFGDDVDRVLEKQDGSKTYFANDMTYHNNKVDRGFNIMIDILGVDHKGYAKRISAATKAISNGSAQLKVLFTEMVNLIIDGEAVKMSKRQGTFVTLAEVLDKVNKDVFRFMMIARSNESPIDFDINQAVATSEQNPVFYVQYAYARINSVFDKAKEVFEDIDQVVVKSAPFHLLSSDEELDLIKALAGIPNLLRKSLTSNNILLLHLILIDIAKHIHSMWNLGKQDPQLRFIMSSNKNLTLARISLLKVAGSLMHSIFKIVGVEGLETM